MIRKEKSFLQQSSMCHLSCVSLSWSQLSSAWFVRSSASLATSQIDIARLVFLPITTSYNLTQKFNSTRRQLRPPAGWLRFLDRSFFFWPVTPALSLFLSRQATRPSSTKRQSVRCRLPSSSARNVPPMVWTCRWWGKMEIQLSTRTAATAFPAFVTHTHSHAVLQTLYHSSPLGWDQNHHRQFTVHSSIRSLTNQKIPSRYKMTLFRQSILQRISDSS